MTPRVPSLIVASAVLLGCTEATQFERPEPYAFSIDCGVEGVCNPVAGDLKLIFHWPPHSLPVRIWAEPRNDLPRFVREGAQAWIGAMAYGELRVVLVADSSNADIHIRWGEPQNIDWDGVGEPPPGCSSRTPIDVALDTTIALPFRSTIHPRIGASDSQLSRCYPIAVAHELGHTFGLFLHSDDPADLMYGQPREEGPSPRDRATVSTLYHTTPTIRLPADR